MNPLAHLMKMLPMAQRVMSSDALQNLVAKPKPKSELCEIHIVGTSEMILKILGRNNSQGGTF